MGLAKRWRWLLVGLCLSITSCNESSRTESPVAPVVAPPAPSSATATYTLVRDRRPLRLDPLALVGSLLIGPEGGKVSILNHKIHVPAGAVSVPTLFTLSVLPTGFIEVELTALLPILGGFLDVGDSFNKPVTLILTYRRAPASVDPSRLLIVRVNGSVYEPLVSKVDTEKEIVAAKLTHFSKYAMAQN